MEQQLDEEIGNELDFDPDECPSDNDVPQVTFNEIDLVNIATSYDSFNEGTLYGVPSLCFRLTYRFILGNSHRTYTFVPQYSQYS